MAELQIEYKRMKILEMEIEWIPVELRNGINNRNHKVVHLLANPQKEIWEAGRRNSKRYKEQK